MVWGGLGIGLGGVKDRSCLQLLYAVYSNCNTYDSRFLTGAMRLNTETMMFIIRTLGTLFNAVFSLMFAGLCLALISLSSANIQQVLKAAPAFYAEHSAYLPLWLLVPLATLTVLVPLAIYSISYAKLTMVTYADDGNGSILRVTVPTAPEYSLPMFRDMWGHAFYRIAIHLPYFGSHGFARFTKGQAHDIGAQLAGWHQSKAPWATDALAANTGGAKAVHFIGAICYDEQNPMLVKVSAADWLKVRQAEFRNLSPLMQRLRKAYEKQGPRVVFELKYAIPAGGRA